MIEQIFSNPEKTELRIVMGDVLIIHLGSTDLNPIKRILSIKLAFGDKPTVDARWATNEQIGVEDVPEEFKPLRQAALSAAELAVARSAELFE